VDWIEQQGKEEERTGLEWTGGLIHPTRGMQRNGEDRRGEDRRVGERKVLLLLIHLKHGNGLERKGRERRGEQRRGTEWFGRN
jgi:hypothetical protein